MWKHAVLTCGTGWITLRIPTFSATLASPSVNALSQQPVRDFCRSAQPVRVRWSASCRCASYPVHCVLNSLSLPDMTWLEPNDSKMHLRLRISHLLEATWLRALSALQVVLCAGQPDVLDRISNSDDLYICAYPYFNVSEMLAVARLYEKSTAQSGKPIIVFNGTACRPPPPATKNCRLLPAERFGTLPLS